MECCAKEAIRDALNAFLMCSFYFLPFFYTGFQSGSVHLFLLTPNVCPVFRSFNLVSFATDLCGIDVCSRGTK